MLPEIIQKLFHAGNEEFDALLASTIEYVCDEQGVEAPKPFPGCCDILVIVVIWLLCVHFS